MRHRTKRILAGAFRLMVALILATGVGPGCAPEIARDPSPDLMQFDPSADPPRAPEPNIVAVNQETGLIDFDVLGIWLPLEPTDCVDYPDIMPVAQCEFYHYLETLDGFPTVSTGTAPATAALDLATLTIPDNLFILEIQGSSAVAVTDVELSWDAEENELVITRPAGWEIGRKYVVAVRGYDDGVRTVDGNRVVASPIYFMLKQTESLITCEADPQSEAPEDQTLNTGCKWYELMLNQGLTPEEAGETLVSLEALRQGFNDEELWDNLELFNDMPKEEIAIVWVFPIHSNPVAELDPARDKVPELVSSDLIRLPVRGSLDASTLTPFSITDRGGTVIFMNLTALAEEDVVNGFPPLQVGYADGTIELQLAGVMQNQNMYGIILVTRIDEYDIRPGIEDPDGIRLAPNPTAVLLRSRGPIVDSNGVSLVSSVGDADAAEAEAGRLQFADLLENDTAMGLMNLERENIAYVYGFEY